MTAAPSRVIVMAAGLAVIMHLLLFAAIQPETSVEHSGVLVAPRTSYLARADSGLSMSGHEVRTIHSPVIFSLPSGLGFSRELTEKDVTTRLIFSQQVEAERFLEVDPAELTRDSILEPEGLMVTAGEPESPGLPADIFQPREKKGAARRVNLEPMLKERLEGGMILPPALNQAASSPWEIHATISVTEYGSVDHVFLDQPLDSASLNQKLLNVLYSLRFKPGSKLVGSIEIYSPEAVLNNEVSP